ncbi:hypothetical protein ACLOJK_003921 [Asimina triloba]
MAWARGREVESYSIECGIGLKTCIRWRESRPSGDNSCVYPFTGIARGTSYPLPMHSRSKKESMHYRSWNLGSTRGRVSESSKEEEEEDFFTSDTFSDKRVHPYADMEVIPHGDPVHEPEEAPRASLEDHSLTGNLEVVGLAGNFSREEASIGNATGPVIDAAIVMMANVALARIVDREVEARAAIKEARGVSDATVEAADFVAAGFGGNSSVGEPLVGHAPAIEAGI